MFGLVLLPNGPERRQKSNLRRQPAPGWRNLRQARSAGSCVFSQQGDVDLYLPRGPRSEQIRQRRQIRSDEDRARTYATE
jgi:hypothetical protein